MSNFSEYAPNEMRGELQASTIEGGQIHFRTTKRYKIFRETRQEIIDYAEQYKCSDYDAFQDWLGEGEADRWLIELLEIEFKLN